MGLVFLCDRPMLELRFPEGCYSSLQHNIHPCYKWKKNKKHRIIPLLFIPYPWLLVYTPLGKGQDIHLYVCLLFASLRYAWLNVVSSTWAPTSRSPLQESRGPEGLLPQTCSWLAKGDLLTWVFHHGKGDAKQEGLEVFQQAVGSDGKIWRLASK